MLTPKGVEHAKPHSARYELPDGGGLYLVVQPSGAKSCAIRYRRHGRSEKLTVKGSYPAVTLAAARAEARKIQDVLAHGNDPKTRGSDTVSALAVLYDRHHIAGLRPGTQLLKRRQMAAIVKAWGARPIASITRKDVIKLIDSAAQTANTANDRAKSIASFLQWCVERGEIDFNVAHRIKRRSTKSRDRVLTDDELAAIWHQAISVGACHGALVRLLILTGARRDEIASLRWSEIIGNEIQLSGERTKNGVPHGIAITPAMADVLDQCPRNGDYALNGNFKVNLSARMRKRLNPPGITNWRLHDLRRTFASGCAKLGIPPDIIERCLNHSKASTIAAVYNRHSYTKEMRDCWERWSAYVGGLLHVSSRNRMPSTAKISQ
jgi:integrase